MTDQCCNHNCNQGRNCPARRDGYGREGLSLLTLFVLFVLGVLVWYGLATLLIRSVQ